MKRPAAAGPWSVCPVRGAPSRGKRDQRARPPATRGPRHKGADSAERGLAGPELVEGQGMPRSAVLARAGVLRRNKRRRYATTRETAKPRAPATCDRRERTHNDLFCFGARGAAGGVTDDRSHAVASARRRGVGGWRDSCGRARTSGASWPRASRGPHGAERMTRTWPEERKRRRQVRVMRGGGSGAVGAPRGRLRTWRDIPRSARASVASESSRGPRSGPR